MYWAFSVFVIFLSGVGIGINWGILMILIFEQEEFQKAQKYAATIIPNIIRFSLFFILLFPPLLKLGIDDTNNQDHKISQLGGLAVLVYLPFVFTLLVFKDKGERQARYALEDKKLREMVDEIINLQKLNNQNPLVNSEDPNELLREKFSFLKEELRDKLKAQTFDLINFYYAFGDEPIEGTEFTEEEEKNGRTEAIKTILENTANKGLINLLAISSEKRLSCIVIHNQEEIQNDNVDLSISLLKEEKEIIEKIQKEGNIPMLTKEEVRRLKTNIKSHKGIAKESKRNESKDYFVYIIRPIEDIAGVDTYLVLQRPTFITDKAIGSFQTLIDLTLLKHGKNLQQRLEAEKIKLEKEVKEKESENSALEKENKDFKVKLNVKETKEAKITNWENRVANGWTNYRNVLNELITYATELHLEDFVIDCRQLLGQFNNQYILRFDFDVLSSKEFTLRLNQVNHSLLRLLAELRQKEI